MKTKRIVEIVAGDRMATDMPDVDALATHSYAPGNGIMAKPFKGGDPVPAWLVVWKWMGGPKAGQRGFEFLSPDDVVRLI